MSRTSNTSFSTPRFPRIAVKNGLESHQPPLYYALAAGWQELLAIPTFTPDPVMAKYEGPDHLANSTNYSPSQLAAARHIHELRILSVFLGLATVLLTYAGAKVIGMRESWALACGLIPALWPKAVVAAATVTNDAFVTPLCALATVLFVMSERAGMRGDLNRRRIILVVMGLVLGAAAITKLNSLPIALVLLGLALVPSLAGPGRGSNDARLRLRLALDVALALVGFLVVSGWWFIRNHELYGQYLATNASEQYLGSFLLHPIPWGPHLVFSNFPDTLLSFSWFTQPNFFLPRPMNVVLAILAVPCLVVGAWIMLRRRSWVSSGLSPLSGIALLLCALAGFVATFIIVKDTSIGDIRDAFVALVPLAIIITTGSIKIFTRLDKRLTGLGIAFWPAVLFALDIYVLVRFIGPFSGT